MKKILPYLKFIVPIACLISVSIVIFMAIKVDDLKDQKEFKEEEYSAEKEFFGSENTQEENIIENTENKIEEKNTTKKEKVYGISTYDLNEIDESEEKNTASEEPVKTAYSEDDKTKAIKIIEGVLGTEKYEITYKEFSVDGEYIFTVKNLENEKILLKAVDVVNEIVSNYE